MPKPVHVAIGCSTFRDYDFLLPITCQLWRTIVGWQPLCLLVEDETFWRAIPRSSRALDALDAHDFRIRWIGHIEGPFQLATVAQNARQHVGLLDLPEDDWIALSDADLWPLNATMYHRLDQTKRMALFYSNAYAYENYCTCHMVASVKTWREIMGFAPGVGLNKWLTLTLENELGKNQDSWKAWNIDEWSTSKRIKAMPWHPSEVQMIERRGGPPVDRIDRSAWPEHPSIEGMTDAHLLRPAQWPENWCRVRPLLEQAIPDQLPWIDDYYKAYVAAEGPGR